MARSRNIKPGFFTNDLLGELPPLARLLFAGLWTICDRDGRVEDRPKKIKAETLPYDKCDADELLEHLAATGFIRRYTQSGLRLIQVLAWHKHQTPHIKESPSTLPAYVEAPPKQVPSTTKAGPEHDLGEVEHQTSTVLEPDKHRKFRHEHPLIPDSLNLIPDSPKSISSNNGCGLKHTVPVDNSKNQLAQKSNSKPRPDLNPQWWRSHAGIEAAARTLHVKPKPGETHTELKQRCFAKIHPKEGQHVP